MGKSLGLIADKNTQSRQFAFFLLCSGGAAICNVLARIIIENWLNLTISVILAYIVGMATAFTLNKLFVFKSSTSTLKKQVALFIFVNFVALLQTLAVTLLFASAILPWFHLHQHVDTIAHIIGVAFPAVTSFVGHKYLTFR